MEKRFQRPICEYSGSEDLSYRDKYQKDSKAVPKVAISSAKMDGDFNYIVDAMNTLDEDVKSVVHNGIANSTIGTGHLVDGSITGSKILEDSIESKHIKVGSITNAKVADLSVTTPKIANNSVTLDKMATDSVSTDEVVDGSITKDKLAEDVIMDSIPVGVITQFSVDILPAGWLECCGADVSKDSYPKLVRFLTNSDLEITAKLPTINPITEEKDGQTVIVAKSAIKAFSDSPELANLEIAGLTQDVTVNAVNIEQNKNEIAKMALKKFEPIAEAYILPNCVCDFSYNIDSIFKTCGGTYRVALVDELKGCKFFIVATSQADRVVGVLDSNYPEGWVDIRIMGTNGACYDSSFYIRVFKIEENLED